MTEPGSPPASRYAGQIVRFAPPLLRIRYPDAVYVNLRGYPDWVPYARALVEVATPPPDAPADEVRVVDVLAANRLMARSGDPLWQRPAVGSDGAPGTESGLGDGPVAESGLGGGPVATPDGWVWAHLAMSRRLALVPVEVHAAFRHSGGIATLPADHSGVGLSIVGGGPSAPFVGEQEAAESDVAELEQQLGVALPAPYRDFLKSTNGGRPVTPAVHPRFGFVADQSLFGLGRQDWFRNLGYVRQWLSDRFTDDFLPIGHVQGGILALRLTGEDAGSVWYYDDDDPRDDDSYDASVVCGRLLRRCGNDFAAFLDELLPVPDVLNDVARSMMRRTLVWRVDEPSQGGALPADRRPS